MLIKAAPRAVWEAITTTSWKQEGGYESAAEQDMFPVGTARDDRTAEGRASADVIMVGDVLEADPPRRLVQTWRALPVWRGKAGGSTRIIWEIKDAGAGLTALTVTRELDSGPQASRQTPRQLPERAERWDRLLRDMKSLLEAPNACGESS